MHISSNKPLTNLIYQQIYRDVVDGSFDPDEILTEGRLIQRYGVSKSPVREALISLCDERVLQSIPRTGYRIVRFTLDELRQIAQARQVLELSMFEKAYPEMGQEEIRILTECNDRIRAEDDPSLSPNMRWESNSFFHLLLASFAKNDYMYDLLKNTLRVNARAATQYFQNIYAPELEHKKFAHERFLQACQARDYAAARDTLIEDTNQLFWWEVKHA